MVLEEGPIRAARGDSRELRFYLRQWNSTCCTWLVNGKRPGRVPHIRRTKEARSKPGLFNNCARRPALRQPAHREFLGGRAFADSPLLASPRTPSSQPPSCDEPPPPSPSAGPSGDPAAPLLGPQHALHLHTPAASCELRLPDGRSFLSGFEALVGAFKSGTVRAGL